MTAAADATRAVEAALRPPGQITTLIIPADSAWEEAGDPAPPLPRPPIAKVGRVAINRVASALKRAGKSAILMRGAALKERGLKAAGRNCRKDWRSHFL
jgi:acetolactate synthase-1/2/3 large subunit